jgi:hypothetical protein
MTYDIDNPGRGTADCPKCRFTMEPLRQSVLLARNEGYMLDSGVGWDPNDNVATSALLGSPSRFLWRHFVEPIANKLFGEWKNRRRRRILELYPASLICPHCHYILKRSKT